MGFNEHGFRSGGMFLHINMQDACVFCDWNDYHQRSHIVGWGFTQILSKAPTRKAKSPTFFFLLRLLGLMIICADFGNVGTTGFPASYL